MIELLPSAMTLDELPEDDAEAAAAVKLHLGLITMVGAAGARKKLQVKSVVPTDEAGVWVMAPDAKPLEIPMERIWRVKCEGKWLPPDNLRFLRVDGPIVLPPRTRPPELEAEAAPAKDGLMATAVVADLTAAPSLLEPTPYSDIDVANVAGMVNVLKDVAPKASLVIGRNMPLIVDVSALASIITDEDEEDTQYPQLLQQYLELKYPGEEQSRTRQLLLRLDLDVGQPALQRLLRRERGVQLVRELVRLLLHRRELRVGRRPRGAQLVQLARMLLRCLVVGLPALERRLQPLHFGRLDLREDHHVVVLLQLPHLEAQLGFQVTASQLRAPELRFERIHLHPRTLCLSLRPALGLGEVGEQRFLGFRRRVEVADQVA